MQAILVEYLLTLLQRLAFIGAVSSSAVLIALGIAKLIDDQKIVRGVIYLTAGIVAAIAIISAL